VSKKLTVVRLKNGRVPGPVLRENLAGRKLPGGSLDDGRVVRVELGPCSPGVDERLRLQLRVSKKGG
jgi:hypothetical protein